MNSEKNKGAKGTTDLGQYIYSMYTQGKGTAIFFIPPKSAPLSYMPRLNISPHDLSPVWYVSLTDDTARKDVQITYSRPVWRKPSAV